MLTPQVPIGSGFGPTSIASDVDPGLRPDRQSGDRHDFVGVGASSGRVKSATEPSTPRTE
jgi:hypothetical protein